MSQNYRSNLTWRLRLNLVKSIEKTSQSYRFVKACLWASAHPTFAKIEALSLEQVESLGEDLLDFTSIADLESWLSQN